MASIRQDVSTDLLPDFRNLGVLARVLVGIHAVALAWAVMSSADLVETADVFMRSATFIEPLLIAAMVALFVLSPALARLPYWSGWTAVLAIVVVLTGAAYAAYGRVLDEPPSSLWRMVVLSAGAAAGLLAYFQLATRAYSPALAEARLQALQARIRPHFLFNSLNAVLSLIRKDPKRAERALEDLADLFRTLMADARRFVRLADEIGLLERYAAIEQLRLGERLRITWDLDTAPSDALLPPLILQPLLENAVYHGVEPGTEASDVLVRIERRGDRVAVLVENPFLPEQHQRAGNRMALENIRERLALFFDAEAKLDTGVEAGRYRVRIEIPYRTQPHGREISR
jgi:two-component system sensor histidine kinase AlgZ